MSSLAAVEQSLARINDPSGEGKFTFMSVAADRAKAEGAAQDALRKAGGPLGPLAGLTLSVKDLFDVAGEASLAGSIALKGAAPATADCPAVSRLRQAGAIALGRTGMSEFAYSGVGHNPHYGTPASPWDRKNNRRIPGGSSSGAGVSVADGMADIGLGSDTGGSVRVPAAMNGVVGFKPTAARVPTANVLPLSTSLDSIGPLAKSVDLCALADAVLAGETPRALQSIGIKGLRFFVPTTQVLEDLSPEVATDFERALDLLSKAGAVFSEGIFPGWEARMAAAAKGGIVGAEAWTWHRGLLEEKGELYDRRIRHRLHSGRDMSAADYLDCLAARRAYQAAWAPILAEVDAILMPTAAIIPPTIASIEEDDAEFTRINGLALRNAATINVLDGCGLALPMMEPGSAPTSLMIAGGAFSDHRILTIGKAVETLLKP
ncbi:amidase [Lacibacterium aquatile]|uniref:Amidase n=1 Tax=Lacibacterium aquatile TaxID=1168082 RepID=A0ABW5DTZ0_9PROT